LRQGSQLFVVGEGFCSCGFDVLPVLNLLNVFLCGVFLFSFFFFVFCFLSSLFVSFNNTSQRMESKERFYRRQFPLVDEVVMVKILSVTDLGATCCLLEYSDIEGWQISLLEFFFFFSFFSTLFSGFIASSDYSRKVLCVDVCWLPSLT
jgi:hypothetical protein